MFFFYWWQIENSQKMYKHLNNILNYQFYTVSIAHAYLLLQMFTRHLFYSVQGNFKHAQEALLIEKRMREWVEAQLKKRKIARKNLLAANV